MTLKEKFDIISCKDCDIPYCDNKCTFLSDNELDRLEKIAEEFAIGFAEWCLKIRFEPIENVSVKKLLEIYKKDNL